MKVIEYQTGEERTQILTKECPRGTAPYVIVDFEYPNKRVVTIERSPFYDEAENFLMDTWLDMEIRPKRNELLQEADVMMLADRYNAMPDAEKQYWILYRQNLRDLPNAIKAQNPTGPVEVEWPTKPVA